MVGRTISGLEIVMKLCTCLARTLVSCWNKESLDVMRRIVYMSAVIHQVCDACEYQKWTPQLQSDSCCQHSYAHACSIGVCVNMFLHCMYYAQMYAALLTILQRPIAMTVYWAWLVRVLSGLFPACLWVSVYPSSACCLCCPLILWKPFIEPWKLHDNRTHDNRTVRQVRKTYEISMNMVRSHGGGGAPGIVKVTNQLYWISISNPLCALTETVYRPNEDRGVHHTSATSPYEEYMWVAKIMAYSSNMMYT